MNFSTLLDKYNELWKESPSYATALLFLFRPEPLNNDGRINLPSALVCTP